jgi:hypothetical protein
LSYAHIFIKYFLVTKQKKKQINTKKAKRKNKETQKSKKKQQRNAKNRTKRKIVLFYPWRTAP